MKKLINILPFLLCIGIFSCTAGTTAKTEQTEVQPIEAMESPLLTEEQESEQKPDIAQEGDTLKIYQFDVTVGGKTWPREQVYIEQAQLMKMDEKGPFPLVVILKGPPIDGKQGADLRLWFSIPADYDGSAIRHDLAKNETGEYVISFSEDEEAYTTWVAPWINTYDHENRKAINDPKTSGTVTLESFDQSANRLRITFDGVLFGASSDTTTHTQTAKGTIELQFSVYDIKAETERMMKEWGL
ncbi:hypothetical protein [Sphingobacterium wenxiniae]|uniref:Lipoprotein n=1 Tax=Sphingobacterium wenxiniae TaxID=683125 RepID=A0A1I6VQN3_9SPHI|nr:hypothetical protein [Sphingobacterium wenxiniae]SFT16033.1 hypothetical protein SAMN05660206_11642 [Sphingobacterium wenxiniae]